MEQQLREDYRTMLGSLRTSMRRHFDQRYHRASEALLATQVGNRSANSVFSEAILYVLDENPLATVHLHPAVQSLLPDLCDDGIELIINGERYGKRWKHQVRNAQQALKRAGLISFDGTQWSKIK
ncbi:MAG TPA: hypothetical protein VMR52_10095 [Dehalococcoidia bacterium]|nr:hypothetical protein [Dehalococcoidia bacterium]